MADNLVLAEHYECGIEIHAAGSGGFLAAVNLPDGSSFANDEPAQFDPIQFVSVATDPQSYGDLLLQTFLAGRPREGLAVARRLAAQGGQRLRLRLDIAPDAASLHSLSWEWLYDSGTDTPFAASPEMSMCRFLEVDKPLGEPVDTMPLKVLVVISNPINLGDYSLPAVDPAVERLKIEEALIKVQGQVACAFLDGPATLQNINDRLTSDRFHVLHLVGHGFFKQKGYLALEGDQRQAVMVDEGSFDDLFLGQKDTRLVVLAACVSAARSQTNAFVGLAPSLVKRGVPAVVAMQRRVTVTAAQIFTEHFYRHLSRYGVIDAAVNAARYQLYLDPDRKVAGDWGTPVVFMRVAKGELFYPTAVIPEIGGRLPPALRDRYLKEFRQFVDRDEQFAYFQGMVKGREDERLACLQGPEGMGKSWLVHRCQTWCSDESACWATVDFDEDKALAWDYVEVLDELISGILASLPSPAAAPVAPGAVAAAPPVDPFDDFRRLIEQGVGANTVPALDSETRRAVSQAFLKGVSALGPSHAVVLFLDALNKASPRVNDWLWSDLLPAFRSGNLPLGHVTIVMAGRSAPPPDPEGRWYHVRQTLALPGLDLKHFIDYARRRGFGKLDEAVLTAFYQTTVANVRLEGSGDLTPKRLSLVLDVLEAQYANRPS